MRRNEKPEGARSWAGFACNRWLDFLANFPARVKGAPPLARVEVDGVDLVASFTVRHQSDGQWYYNAVALHDAKEKAQDSYGRPDQQAGSSVAPIAGLSGFIRRPLAQINPEAVSRVVDPDTGGNEGGDALTYFDAYASNYGLAAQIWLAIPARNCGALAGLKSSPTWMRWRSWPYPPQAAAVSRSSAAPAKCSTLPPCVVCINRLEIEPEGH